MNSVIYEYLAKIMGKDKLIKELMKDKGVLKPQNWIFFEALGVLGL